MLILIGGLAGALALPVTMVGVGWAVVAVALAAVAVAARRRPRPGALGVAVVAVLLAGTGTVRAAGWLLVLCLAAALLLAVVDDLTWRGLLRAPLVLPHSALTGLRAAVTGQREGGERGADGGSRSGRPAVLGWAVALVAVAIFGGLLAAADGIFAELLRDLLPGPGELARAAAGFLLAALLAAALVGRGAAVRTPVQDGPAVSAVPDHAGRGRAPRTLVPGEWVPTVALLDVLFGGFVVVQVTTWFRGHDYVLDPAGPTYAEYARGGFGQLLAVTLLTLGVVGVVAARAARDTARRRLLLRSLGGALCLFTLVVVASAVTRMALYVQAYGFTRPRLLADALVLWLGLIFVAILVAGVRLSMARLPHVVVGSAVLVLFGLVAVNPDAMVARTVIGRYQQDGHLDAGYLSVLSADAVTELDRLPEPHRTCALAHLVDDLREPDPWYGFNISRARARALLAERPLLAAELPHCWPRPYGGPQRDG
ncbi:hypothetical protein Cme02nite_10360 [Catellatospora methionotrophica]|uniref:DUF4173 domain-containing protein n=1 Tax=Catellatospora methionotrophica TaxID=121620 RepID=A0A8J3L6Z4_9ACTN|nr:DUF4173 domain-containing protein [Catellatospora methionotrophica]GIG12704.1 hypothetical protein Cme02nite_10360 [Catellatospora methionotrophica]